MLSWAANMEPRNWKQDITPCPVRPLLIYLGIFYSFLIKWFQHKKGRHFVYRAGSFIGGIVVVLKRGPSFLAFSACQAVGCDINRCRNQRLKVSETPQTHCPQHLRTWTGHCYHKIRGCPHTWWTGEAIMPSPYGEGCRSGRSRYGRVLVPVSSQHLGSFPWFCSLQV